MAKEKPSCRQVAPVKRAKPFDADQHGTVGRALAAMGNDLMDFQESVGKCYPHSTEPARAVRELIRSYNRVRSALVSRFFGEGHSVDGTSPYYPVGMKPVKPAEKPEGAEEEPEE